MYEQEWISYLRNERRYSPLTVRNYTRDLRDFTAFVLDRSGASVLNPADVTADDVREWIMHMSDSGRLSAASINRAIYSLHSYFRYLRQRDIVRTDIMERVGTLKTSSRLPSYVRDEKMDDILAGILAEPRDGPWRRCRDRMIVLMFYALGIRLAELVAVDTDDFEQDFRLLKVHGKGDKQRLLPVVDSLREEIMYFLGSEQRRGTPAPAEKAMFLSGKGVRISRIEVYRVVKQRLGMQGAEGRQSPHVLRHTFATRLMNSGVDMRLIQELLGHNSLSATQVYTHNSIAALKEAYSRAHPRARAGHKD